jgi:GTPase SAR1 family protein
MLRSTVQSPVYNFEFFKAILTMKHSILRFILFSISMASPFEFAMAGDRLPTDIELHAVYCIPMVNSEIAIIRTVISTVETELQAEVRTPNLSLKNPSLFRKLKELLPKWRQELSDTESALRRLRLYIAPRMYDLDPTSLLTASLRAEEDLDLIRKKADVCAVECSKNDAPSNCVNTCADLGPEFRQRLEACRKPSWLPY